MIDLDRESLISIGLYTEALSELTGELRLLIQMSEDAASAVVDACSDDLESYGALDLCGAARCGDAAVDQVGRAQLSLAR